LAGVLFATTFFFAAEAFNGAGVYFLAAGFAFLLAFSACFCAAGFALAGAF